MTNGGRLSTHSVSSSLYGLFTVLIAPQAIFGQGLEPPRRISFHSESANLSYIDVGLARRPLKLRLENRLSELAATVALSFGPAVPTEDVLEQIYLVSIPRMTCSDAHTLHSDCSSHGTHRGHSPVARDASLDVDLHRGVGISTRAPGSHTGSNRLYSWLSWRIHRAWTREREGLTRI